MVLIWWHRLFLGLFLGGWHEILPSIFCKKRFAASAGGLCVGILHWLQALHWLFELLLWRGPLPPWLLALPLEWPTLPGLTHLSPAGTAAAKSLCPPSLSRSFF